MVISIEASRPAPTPTHEALRQQHRASPLPVLLGVLLAVGLVVLVIVLLMHFNKGDSHASAPWAKPGAPIVHPPPIKAQ
jgi:hypothetical protein